MIVHDKWTGNGRLLKDTENPNRHIWKSGVGQKNVSLGNGNYAPYVWDKVNKILKFADCEIRFTANGLEFWHGKKLFTSAFYPETKTTDWNRPTVIASELNFKENKTLKNKDTIEISYKLTTDDQEGKITIKAGGRNIVHFAFQVKAKTAGFQRLNWECDIAEKGQIAEPYYDELKQKQMNPRRYRFKDFYFGWTNDEWADREIIDTKTKVEFRLKEAEYEANEIKTFSPDIWGETEIVHTNDDCQCKDDGTVDLDGLDSDGSVFGNQGGPPYHNGWRWQNVTIAKGSTINSTTIDYWVDYVETEIPIPGILWGSDEDDAADWSAGTAPTVRTKTTANVVYSAVNSTGEHTTDDIKTIIAEITSRDSWASGNDLAIMFFATVSDTGDMVQIEDLSTVDDGTDAAAITIDYTAAAGGLSPTGVLRGPLGGPLFGPIM